MKLKWNIRIIINWNTSTVEHMRSPYNVTMHANSSLASITGYPKYHDAVNLLCGRIHFIISSVVATRGFFYFDSYLFLKQCDPIHPIRLQLAYFCRNVDEVFEEL